MGSCWRKPYFEEDSIHESLLTGSIIVRDVVANQRSLLTSRSRQTDPTLFYFDPLKSNVEWNQSDTVTAGTTTVATIRFVCRNGTPYTFRNDHFIYSIVHDSTHNEMNSIREPSMSLNGHTSVRISFTPRDTGTYIATFKVNDQKIGGTVYRRLYVAGPPVANRTVVHHQANHLILQCGTYFSIMVSPRDNYGNIARLNSDLLFIEVKKNGATGVPFIADHYVENVGTDQTRVEILVKLDEPGYYVGCLKYEDKIIGLQNMLILCLTDSGIAKMEENINCKFLSVSYKAKLIPQNNPEETRKVKCFLSPRLFQVRGQHLFNLISSRVFTCRVCNNTQFILNEELEKFTIDDGIQTPITLISPHRETIVAVFHSFVQRNVGGAESFHDKQRLFWTELRNRNPDMQSGLRREVRINIRRYDILESAMLATRGFKVDMWKRKFSVSFEGEAGIDVGGVSREFFTCLCDTIFGGRNPHGLFTRFSDDPQGLVHPTSKKKRDSRLKLEHYEFAGHIVGKCLYESAMTNPLFVKAQFTRSFLAQIIGLRISWKHFETDDPELYQYKVEQIKDNSVEDLDLSLRFVEEEFNDDPASHDPLLVSLQPGGRRHKVTDQNKMDYLTKLAQYRLVTRVSEEIRSFLKGMRDIIPDELLGIFDENELELLMCGIQELSFDDLKHHTEIRGYSQSFLQVVEWFWIAVQEFNQEELARLVQFVTGSSQIPPGGFAELRPPFLLASSGEDYNRLPYAHTCFNHLCLPNYDTYEQFRRNLMTAINEGCEGILLS